MINHTLPAWHGWVFIGIGLVLIIITYLATRYYREKGPERTSIISRRKNSLKTR